MFEERYGHGLFRSQKFRIIDYFISRPKRQEKPTPLSQTEIGREFDKAMKKQGLYPAEADTRKYGEEAVKPGTPSDDGDIF